MRNPVCAFVILFLCFSFCSSLSADERTACEHGICFRFPGKDRSKFVPAGADTLGPYLMDHLDLTGGVLCQNYLGQAFPNCYGGHSGSDFMLDGGFVAMEDDVEVVAAARGEVIDFRDDAYDKCHVSPRDLLEGGDGITCGSRPITGNPRDQVNNYVVIRHWNGRYYVYSSYHHLKRGSVPGWIKEALAEGRNPEIKCGETIGFVGSSGTSAAPHVHFSVRVALNPVLNEYADADPFDPYCGPYTPYRNWSMWTEHTDPWELPGASCQDPYDPLLEDAPQFGVCFVGPK